MKMEERMSHLPIERLAELADGEPDATERAHLAECVMCSTELAVYERLVAAAADERRRIAPPLTNWRALREPLREEGLIITQEHQIAQRRHAVTMTWVRRAAAAVLMIGSGLVLGRFSAGLSLPQALAMQPVAADSVPDGVISAQEFASAASAMEVLRRAQREYEQAALYLATHDTISVESAPDVYRARLAALDQMTEASLRALERAPADPIMNQIYLTTLGAREMTLSRLGTTLPTGARLHRF